jgi:hypothetical protein
MNEKYLKHTKVFHVELIFIMAISHIECRGNRVQLKILGK